VRELDSEREERRSQGVPRQALVGDTIEQINRDLVPHAATADNNKWNTRLLVNGASAHIVVMHTGTLSFHCFHPKIKGVVTVNSRTEPKS
jgi:plastocyanin